MATLIDFHTRNKLLLLSHSQKHYRLMGKLVAEGKQLAPKELLGQYVRLLMEALALKTTTKEKHQRPAALDGIFQTAAEW